MANQESIDRMLEKSKIILNQGIYDVDKAIKSQNEYCEANGLPNFARIFTNRGVCFNCSRNIYQRYNKSGYDVAYAMSKLVTACPHCHRSYCD